MKKKKEKLFLYKKIINSKEGFILHYTGGGIQRPWLNKNCIYGEYFWKYAKMTSFYDILVSKLNDYEKERDEIHKHFKEIKMEYSKNKFIFNFLFGEAKEKSLTKLKELKKKLKKL